MAMMRSATFRDLDSRASKHGPIRLIDSSATGEINYDHDEHCIQIPATQPVKELRSSLLFEMHHAADADAGTHNLAKVEEAVGSLTEENAYLEPYLKAAYALSTEWIEWNRVAEACLRANRIDHDLGGNQILREWERFFTAPGRGWFIFDNYLQTQVRMGHTNGYDPQSRHHGWVGGEILAQVRHENASTLLISRDELNDFYSGQRKYIKHTDGNPFRADKVLNKIKAIAAAEIV
jgi:hypothetical protein